MSKAIYKINEIEAIPSRNYEGYLWYSDEERPMYIGEKDKIFDKEYLTTYPFVVEGALYSIEENKSLTIRCLEGKYYIHEIDFNILEQNKKSYRKIPHEWLVAKDVNRKVLMWEVWTLDKDPLCANMPSFRAAFWAFKGFINSSN